MRTERYTYNQNGNTHEYEYDAGNVRQDLFHEYDLVGNITKTLNRVTDCGISGTTLGSNALDRMFEYDALYRLLSATGRESDTQPASNFWDDATEIPKTNNANNVRAYTRSFEYDRMGNITKLVHSASGNGFTRKYNYLTDTNRLDDIDNGQTTPTVLSTFDYDPKGNLTKSNTTRNYEWDYGGRMRSFYNQTSAGVEPSVYAQYVYDASGARVKKFVRKDSGEWESVTYIDGSLEYHKKQNGGGTEEKNYTQVMGGVEIRTGEYTGDMTDTTVYHLSDHLNSATLRIAVGGSVIDREEFYPYGDASLRTFTKKRYRFTGKERDDESGLYYYGARYYAAWTCQFLSVDPKAAETVAFSPYAYGNNNPMTFNDPSGMKGNNKTDGGGGKNSSESNTVVMKDNSSENEEGVVTVDYTTITKNTNKKGENTYVVHRISGKYNKSGEGKKEKLNKDVVPQGSPSKTERKYEGAVRNGKQISSLTAGYFNSKQTKTDSNAIASTSDAAKSHVEQSKPEQTKSDESSVASNSTATTTPSSSSPSISGPASEFVRGDESSANNNSSSPNEEVNEIINGVSLGVDIISDSYEIVEKSGVKGPTLINLKYVKIFSNSVSFISPVYTIYSLTKDGTLSDRDAVKSGVNLIIGLTNLAPGGTVISTGLSWLEGSKWAEKQYSKFSNDNNLLEKITQ